MTVLVNAKWEIFTQNWFLGKPITECAKIAGYTPSRAAQTASRLARYGKIRDRYNELQEQAASDKVASEIERKEILSEIARGKLTNFMECGQDGAWINIDKTNMNTSALQSIDSTTKYDENGSAAVITKIRLHSPVQAISELNKMEHIYEAPALLNQDNRVINIYVTDNEAKDLLERVRNGERTGKLIEGVSSESDNQ